MKNEYRVWHNRNLLETRYYYVKNVEDAKILIKELIKSDLLDEDLLMNAFGLEELTDANIELSKSEETYKDNQGWYEYEDEDGDDIMEIINNNEEI